MNPSGKPGDGPVGVNVAVTPSILSNYFYTLSPVPQTTNAIKHSLDVNPSGKPGDGPVGVNVAITPAILSNYFYTFSPVPQTTNAIKHSLDVNPSGKPGDGPVGVNVAITPATPKIRRALITNASFKVTKQQKSKYLGARLYCSFIELYYLRIM